MFLEPLNMILIFHFQKCDIGIWQKNQHIGATEIKRSKAITNMMNILEDNGMEKVF